MRAPLVLMLALCIASATRGKSLRKEAEDLLAQVRRAERIAEITAQILKEYPKRRDALRELRKRPAPIDTFYKPDYYRSAAGLVELAQKAAVYRETAKKFVHDGVVVDRAYLDPKTRQVTAYVDGLGDTGIYTGP